MKKFTNWAKKHKKEIVVGTVATVGAGILFYKFGIKPSREKAILHEEEGQKILEAFTNTETSGRYPWGDVYDPNEFDFGIGRIDDCWNNDFGPGFIVNDVKLSDLGRLGEGIVNYYDDREAGITPDTFVTMSFDILPNLKEEAN